MLYYDKWSWQDKKEKQVSMSQNIWCVEQVDTEVKSFVAKETTREIESTFIENSLIQAGLNWDRLTLCNLKILS